MDCENSIIKSGECAQYDTIFKHVEGLNQYHYYNELTFEIAMIQEFSVKAPNCKVVLVPSIRDVHHENVFPQPPLEIARVWIILIDAVFCS